MVGSVRIPAAKEAVWQALNDPAILARAIPGCEKMERIADNEFDIAARIRLGPLSLKMRGRMKITDANPPDGCRIIGEGKDAAAGFAKGEAAVLLSQDGDATLLSYSAKAEVGGKIMQLGSRLIDSTAKKYADQFFGTFSAELGGESAAPSPPPKKASAAKIRLWLSLGSAIVAALILAATFGVF